MDGTPEELTKAIVDEIEALIVKEVSKFSDALRDEIGLTPLRADGAMNARDLYDAIGHALNSYRTNR